MALADLHYTTGISSGFKVYILEGQPSLENEQKFQRLPAHRFPVYSIKRKLGVDVRNPDQTLAGQKVSKVRRLEYKPTAASLEQAVAPAVQILEGPVSMSCVTTSRPEHYRDSRALLPSCPHRCPLRKLLLDPTLTVSQLQQMRPSVITCAPRRSCSETPTSTSHPISPPKQRNEGTPFSPCSQRFSAWITNSAAPSTRLGEDASPQQRSNKAEDQHPYCPRN